MKWNFGHTTQQIKAVGVLCHCFVFLYFYGETGLNSRLHAYKAGACKAGTLPLEPHLQSTSAGLFLFSNGR
jgi:hypothetical protein